VCSTLFPVKDVQEFHYVTQQKSAGSFPDKPRNSEPFFSLAMAIYTASISCVTADDGEMQGECEVCLACIS
jgi:hypothetical protein